MYLISCTCSSNLAPSSFPSGLHKPDYNADFIPTYITIILIVLLTVYATLKSVFSLYM